MAKWKLQSFITDKQFMLIISKNARNTVSKESGADSLASEITNHTVRS